jgi:hypothetical protein
VSPIEYDPVLDGTYTLIIDNIEYTLDGNNPTAVEDALKIHEAFYEKEFKEGRTNTIKIEKELSKRWMRLRGISARYRRRGRSNTDYVEYVKSTTAKGIAKWIATTLTRSYSHLDLSNMLWDIPETPGVAGGTIKLRSYSKDVVPQGNFDPDPDPWSRYSYSVNYEARHVAMRAKKTWIKKKTKEIHKELQELQKKGASKMKAKKMIEDYKKLVA